MVCHVSFNLPLGLFVKIVADTRAIIKDDISSWVMLW